MLVCGVVNPPPETDPEYHGVYFNTRDDMEGKARGLKGTPLRVEHGAAADVGKVVDAWTDKRTGAMWALAEMNTSSMPGALAAAAVQRGSWPEFSLGYSAEIQRDQTTQKLRVVKKTINELSLVRKGARPGCHVVAHSAGLIHK